MERLGRLPGIKRVFHEKNTAPSSFLAGLLENVSTMQIEEFPDADRATVGYEGKESLHLAPFRGEFLKKCPGTKGYICCGYRILHIGTGCPMDCSYCILQVYLNQPYLRVFTNLEEKLAGLAEHLDSHPETLFRIGTGEFMDSLALNPVTGWTDLLLPFIAQKKNAVLELKTKSTCIERLLALPFRERIVVSWSLNSPYISSREEHGAPSIRQRIEAARRCQEEGFVVGFHFDPLVPHRGWREGYLRTLEWLSGRVDPERVIWVSMGCMRYLPELKKIVRRRWSGSRVMEGEFILGSDGKMRLFKPIRIEMYGFMAENLARWQKELGVYLCMESHDVWQGGLGWSPDDSEGLGRFLDTRVRRFWS